jgi:DNA-binding MarR family transcriptional regulator
MYDAALAPCGLTSTQLGALDALSDLGSATVRQLAEINGHEQSVTWRGLQPLLRRGLIQRAPTTDRADLYELTEAGAALLETALTHWRLVQDRVLAAVGDDVDRLSAVVDKLEGVGPAVSLAE